MKHDWTYVFISPRENPAPERAYDELYMTLVRTTFAGKTVDLPGLVICELGQGIQLFIRDDYINAGSKKS